MRQQKNSEVLGEVLGQNICFLANPLKAAENQRFSNVFRGWEKRKIKTKIG